MTEINWRHALEGAITLSLLCFFYYVSFKDHLAPSAMTIVLQIVLAFQVGRHLWFPAVSNVGIFESFEGFLLLWILFITLSWVFAPILTTWQLMLCVSRGARSSI